MYEHVSLSRRFHPKGPLSQETLEGILLADPQKPYEIKYDSLSWSWDGLVFRPGNDVEVLTPLEFFQRYAIELGKELIECDLTIPDPRHKDPEGRLGPWSFNVQEKYGITFAYQPRVKVDGLPLAELKATVQVEERNDFINKRVSYRVLGKATPFFDEFSRIAEGQVQSNLTAMGWPDVDFDTDGRVIASTAPAGRSVCKCLEARSTYISPLDGEVAGDLQPLRRHLLEATRALRQLKSEVHTDGFFRIRTYHFNES